jgi:hypothetical protein
MAVMDRGHHSGLLRDPTIEREKVAGCAPHDRTSGVLHILGGLKKKPVASNGKRSIRRTAIGGADHAQVNAHTGARLPVEHRDQGHDFSTRALASLPRRRGE